MKKNMVLFNPRKGSIYVHLDQLLFDLKYDPSIIEMPVPRYFREDDQIPIDIEFKEPVDKGEKKKGGKKKGGKKKGGKKKKKSDDDDDKKEEPKITLAEKKELMDKLYQQYVNSTEPEEEIVHDPFTLDMDIVHAIRLIQKNERGRQGRFRIMVILKQQKIKRQNAEVQKKIREGKMLEKTQEQTMSESSVKIQRRLRGIIARKRVEEMRQEEMIFLGMARKPKTEEEKKNDALKQQDLCRDERIKTRMQNELDFKNEKENLKHEIDINEGTDIKENMLKERRDWVQQWKADHNGKAPEDLKDFYDRFNVETPLTPEEQEAKRLQEEEEAKNKKKKKDGAKKDKGKKKKKKGGDDDDGGSQTVKIGPSEIVRKFDEFYEDYQDVWANRDEEKN